MAGRLGAGRTSSGSLVSGHVALRVDHLPVITCSGVYDMGWVSRFAIVDGPPPILGRVLCRADSTEPQSTHRGLN
jgi:hypothetical protein